MADEEDQIDGEAEGEEEEGKKGGKKKLLIILLPLLLIAGGGGGAYYMGMLDSLLGIEAASEDGEHAEDGEDHGEDDGHGEKKDSHGKKDTHAKKDDGHGGGDDGHGEGDADASAFLPVPAMLVNLNTEDGTPRFLRLVVQLELADPNDSDAVKAVLPKVVDQFQTYLRELRVRDLRGSAGIYRLQMELLWRVNQAVEPLEIKDILFQEILIQ